VLRSISNYHSSTQFLKSAASRVTKAYETETYDYPSQIQESVAELGANISRGVTNFAANNLKGTNLPAPSPTAAPLPQHKTLPHALSRAASSASSILAQAPGGKDDRLGHALTGYAGAWEKIGNVRVQHDDAVASGFLLPWQQNLQTSINVAVKARQAVRLSRLELDAAKQTYVIRGRHLTHPPPHYALLCIHVLTWYLSLVKVEDCWSPQAGACPFRGRECRG
jgi:hypothetical protein